MFSELKENINAYKAKDPAARSSLEVYFLYPGLKAVISHKRANWLYRHKHYFLARWVSQRSRKKTGIEIHPAATIGKRLVIDHGMGIVIGETAVIGDDCLLYQGVTLGGTGKETGKRHPTLGNNVLVGSGAKILGPFSVGDNARIASNAIVLKEVPPNSTAVGVPARIIRHCDINKNYSGNVDQINIQDPIAEELFKLHEQISAMQKTSENIINNIKTEEK